MFENHPVHPISPYAYEIGQRKALTEDAIVVLFVLAGDFSDAHPDTGCASYHPYADVDQLLAILQDLASVGIGIADINAATTGDFETIHRFCQVFRRNSEMGKMPSNCENEYCYYRLSPLHQR
jgi:hypothetical protein